MDNLKAVVLAAGKGSRLQTEGVDLPKVMRLALDKPLLEYVLAGISFISPAEVTIVAGFKKERVIEAFPGYNYAFQEPQLGTGHAVLCARACLNDYGGDVLICYGDMPLVKKESYQALVDLHRRNKNACTILTGTLTDKTGYGRILRDGSGDFDRVVEARDCTAEQLAIDEVNSGVYIFSAPLLLDSLSLLTNNNAQGEYYLTDVPGILKAKRERIGLCNRLSDAECIGVNTIEQLAQVESLLSASPGKHTDLR